MFKSKILFFTVLVLITVKGFSQKLPVVNASDLKIDIRIGNEFYKGQWNLNTSLRPDVYDAYVTGTSTPVTFISDRDSIRFDVKPGHSYPFVFVINGKDSAFTEIKGIKLVPRAVFSNEYKKTHFGKTSVEIPMVYELLNIVFAITETGKKDNGLIYKDMPYYQEVLKWFEPFAKEPVVQRINAELTNPDDMYHALKMDGYSFEFSNQGKIEKSKIYNRIGRANVNFLEPFIDDLQTFATKTNFKKFYQDHSPVYKKQIEIYRDSVGVPVMQKWLTRNFPSTSYESFKIIFSPLVAGNQSASWFENNDFHEAQAHVNFPYGIHNSQKKWSKEASFVMAGSILFTELNHAFIGPEADKPQYRSRITKAFSDLNIWNEKGKPAELGYNDPSSSFDEYMNWGLVSLRYLDYAPKSEQEKLIAGIEKMMVEGRGFKRFAEYNQFLVQLYKNKKQEQTVADLYPEIVSWFENSATR
ncbi:DUF4932 domain-containing protein [Dyadobacter sp. CY312]|uniref:DUF4932 domain-containing protein n=1 Tax=Dyadobacter sp. CY312 TaxID=2907303 RepID=UPI001F3ACA1D|nr:DUF4932 domain-containing protein [Dyadobacter sp. CY312]MCE7039653.1 DUF4932 domain-containing protein [Dyadobacter sp. CY312]